MKLKKEFFFLIFLAILWNSCVFVQEEIDSINIEKLSTKDDLNIFESKPVHIDAGDKIYFWSKFDMEYEGNLKMVYQVQVFNDRNENILLLEMDPLDIDTRVMCVETTLNNKTDYSCTGKIHNFSLPVKANFIEFVDAGDYSFKAIMFTNSIDKLDIKESKLIIKK